MENTDGRSSELLHHPVGSKSLRYITPAGKLVNESTLPDSTLELVRIRASQINCCAFCLDMHTKDAAHAGETPARLSLVASWCEARVYADAERAALEPTEQGTRVTETLEASDLSSLPLSASLRC